MIITNNTGQIVGRTESGVYYTERRPEHFMKKYQGFGISLRILERLERSGVTHIVIKYYGKEDTQIFKFRLSEYLFSDLIHINTQFDNDVQHFVSIYPKKKDKKEEQRKL